MAEETMSPEQIKALQEKIKNMSPDELKEFQKKQCVFCQIISGKVQARKIFEDEKVLAILDINPANPGHVVLLTKEHYSIMPQLPEEEVAYVFMAAKSLSNSMLRSIDAQGTDIIVANGIAAGQRAQHFMIHIIPRKENDGINFVLPQRTLEQEQIESIGNRLIAALGGSDEKEEQQPAQIPAMTKPKPMQAPQPAKQPVTQPRPKPLNIDAVKPEEIAPETSKPAPKEKKAAKSGIDLDDIAKLLGVK